LWHASPLVATTSGTYSLQQNCKRQKAQLTLSIREAGCTLRLGVFMPRQQRPPKELMTASFSVTSRYS
jgi:hypothetical protein